MNRRASVVMAAGLLVAGAVGTSAWQGLVFRARTDVVTVDVDVRRGRNQVSGLVAADFIVRDAGVEQRLQSASTEAVPIDVSLFVDTSGSLSELRLGLERDVNRILAQLRPIDRLRVFTLGYEVHEFLPWEAPGTRPSLTLPPVGRVSAVYDAIWLAMVRRPDPGRRHLVVALTDGRDLSSVTTSASLLEAAGRTEAVLNIVTLREAPGVSRRPEQWSSVEPDAGGLDRLRAAAARTGGRVFAAPTTGAPVVAAFTRVFDEFRRGYVLSYAYEGPPVDGWHDIDVRIGRPGDYTVRARRGYFAAP
jgi:hypothetical protein